MLPKVIIHIHEKNLFHYSYSWMRVYLTIQIHDGIECIYSQLWISIMNRYMHTSHQIKAPASRTVPKGKCASRRGNALREGDLLSGRYRKVRVTLCASLRCVSAFSCLGDLCQLHLIRINCTLTRDVRMGLKCVHYVGGEMCVEAHREIRRHTGRSVCRLACVACERSPVAVIGSSVA